MTIIANTIKRKEVYQFNYRLGQKIYRKSLKTDSPSQTRKYVFDIISFIKRSKVLGIEVEKKDIDNFIELLISNKVNEVVRLAKVVIDPMSTTSKRYFDMWYQQTDQSRHAQYNHDQQDWGYIGITPPPRPEVQHYNKWLSAKLDSAANHCHLESSLSKYDADEEQMVWDTDDNFYNYFQFPTWEAEWYSHLDTQITTHAKNIANAFSKNHSVRARMEVKELQTKFAHLLPTPPPKTEQIQEPNSTSSPYLKEVVDEYIEYAKSKIKAQRKKTEPKKHMRLWLQDFAGLRLDEIHLESIVEAWETINNFPKGKVKDTDLSNKWMDAASGETKDELMGFETAKKYKQEFKKFFSWAADIKRYTKNNPLLSPASYSYLKDYKDRKIPRTKFSNSQAKSIVDFCKKDLSNPYHWAILLMAYHGMRNKEVLTLDKSDIIIDPDTQVVYMFIRKGKTPNAVRKVPVHGELLGMGFLEFVDNQPTSHLFTFSHVSLSPYYLKLRELLGIPPLAEDGNRLSLYSFRHTVISQLTTYNVNRGKQNAIVGHASSEIQAGYTHIDLLHLQVEIEKISYN